MFVSKHNAKTVLSKLEQLCEAVAELSKKVDALTLPSPSSSSLILADDADQVVLDSKEMFRGFSREEWARVLDSNVEIFEDGHGGWRGPIRHDKNTFVFKIGKTQFSAQKLVWFVHRGFPKGFDDLDKGGAFTVCDLQSCTNVDHLCWVPMNCFREFNVRLRLGLINVENNPGWYSKGS